MLNIANRLFIPTSTQALLWDMDGVLIDSLRLDLTVCNQLLHQYVGDQVTVSNEFIRSIFAYDAELFWKKILVFVEETYAIANADQWLEPLLTHFNHARQTSVFPLNPGIQDILIAVRSTSLKMAVVSNNSTAEVQGILTRCGILEYFDAVVGNDIQQVEKKPAPDTYLLAAQLLEVNPERCVAIEDSLVGMEAGHRAACHTVGVATGSADFGVLEQSPHAHQIYSSFELCQLMMQFGDVRKKRLTTPNEFVSHAIEHIAWRLGVEIILQWNNNNWQELGMQLGKHIQNFERYGRTVGVALGMIDDGSAEVMVEIGADAPSLTLDTIANLELDWFLSLRCEQLTNGTPLVKLMQGLVKGLEARMRVKICNVEDPHHAWEGVFRAIGIALNKIFTPQHPAALPVESTSAIIENLSSEAELKILSKSLHASKVWRGTAESHVMVAVDFSKQLPNHFSFQVSPTIEVSELPYLLEHLATAAGFTMQVEFQATVLSSSHVVLEDTALVLGRALLEILTLRMNDWGVNGAGSSLHTLADMEGQPIRVGISVEGRKFWRFVPFQESYPAFKQRFLIGQNVYQHLRSEDLDDFLDGLSGGLVCSIMVHLQEKMTPQEGWPFIFSQLGESLREVFARNPYRKGVPPGVKATLA